MPVLKLYSKRRKEELGEVPDVFSYNEIPQGLKHQIVWIWTRAIEINTGYDAADQNQKSYKYLCDTLAEDLGRPALIDPLSRFIPPYSKQLENYFLQKDLYVDYVLDVIELVFTYISEIRSPLKSQEIIQVLNSRFREHGIGYEFVDKKIIRIDSAFLHQEAVKTALLLIRSLGFKGVEDEFLRAYGHYCDSNYKEAISEASKAYESTMKTILDRLGYKYGKNDTAYKLIEHCIKVKLFAPYHDARLQAIQNLLQSNANSVRNKVSGHGQGESVQVVDEHLVSYVLHMTAATILFLCHCFLIKTNK